MVLGLEIRKWRVRRVREASGGRGVGGRARETVSVMWSAVRWGAEARMRKKESMRMPVLLRWRALRLERVWGWER